MNEKVSVKESCSIKLTRGNEVIDQRKISKEEEIVKWIQTLLALTTKER